MTSGRQLPRHSPFDLPSTCKGGTADQQVENSSERPPGATQLVSGWQPRAPELQTLALCQAETPEQQDSLFSRPRWLPWQMGRSHCVCMLWEQGQTTAVHSGLEAGFLSWTLPLSGASSKAGRIKWMEVVWGGCTREHRGS